MPTLIIHGGAGLQEGRHSRFEHYARHLSTIIDAGYPVLLRDGARAAVIHTIRLLEDDPLFNAGTGAKLQQDGVIRLSAALMDSARGIFAGVINIENVRYPIDIAEHLSRQRHSVLAGERATAYARELGIARHDPITSHRQAEFEQQKSGKTGTVGAVAIDAGHVICAGTSTGGVGYEIPGRVSDSATVAGTYAATAAGVSCTGVGEHVVNHAAAARIVTRIEDGIGLPVALDKTREEADQRGYHYGLIAVDGQGAWGVSETRDVTTLFAAHDGKQIHTFLSKRGET